MTFPVPVRLITAAAPGPFGQMPNPSNVWAEVDGAALLDTFDHVQAWHLILRVWSGTAATIPQALPWARSLISDGRPRADKVARVIDAHVFNGGDARELHVYFDQPAARTVAIQRHYPAVIAASAERHCLTVQAGGPAALCRWQPDPKDAATMLHGSKLAAGHDHPKWNDVAVQVAADVSTALGPAPESIFDVPERGAHAGDLTRYLFTGFARQVMSRKRALAYHDAGIDADEAIAMEGSAGERPQGGALAALAALR